MGRREVFTVVSDRSKRIERSVERMAGCEICISISCRELTRCLCRKQKQKQKKKNISETDSMLYIYNSSIKKSVASALTCHTNVPNTPKSHQNNKKISQHMLSKMVYT